MTANLTRFLGALLLVLGITTLVLLGAANTLPTSVLSKKVTTRLQKKEIREVMGILAKQTGVAITVSEDVPPFRLDAFLINTSLKYALDEITKATKLKYRFTNDLSISVEK